MELTNTVLGEEPDPKGKGKKFVAYRSRRVAKSKQTRTQGGAGALSCTAIVIQLLAGDDAARFYF